MLLSKELAPVRLAFKAFGNDEAVLQMFLDTEIVQDADLIVNGIL